MVPLDSKSDFASNSVNGLGSAGVSLSEGKINYFFGSFAQWFVLPKKRTFKVRIEHIVGLTLHTETYDTFLKSFFNNNKLF